MRKVLSFVLVLALVLGSFSFAFGLTDIEDSANKDAIQVCNDLGIIDGYPDGTFQGEKAVNRAEFAAMITRALGVPDSALAGYATTSFKDVAGYGWAVPYLAFCESKGIMLGDGMGNAMPGRTISVNEAITMALRAVGYTENSAMLVGTWPSNYVTLGQQQNLYTDLATATTIDRENAAQVIYNALSVDLVAVNADGQTEFIVGTGGSDGARTTMLEAYLDCTNEGKVVLGTAGFDFDNALINIGNRLGAYGNAYYNSDDELVAFTPDSTKLTGSVNADGKFVADGVKYTVNTSAFVTGAAVFVNNVIKASNAAIAIVVNQATYENAGDGGLFTINADVSAKVIKDVYSVVDWQATAADQAASDVQDEIADDQKLLGYAFDTDDNDEIVATSFELVGVDSLGDIEEDDVVYVYYDGTAIRKVAVGTETVTGTVEEVNTVDDEVTIAGSVYSIVGLVNTPLGETLTYSAGNEGVLYLDAYGDAYYFDKTSADESNYGVVMDVQTGGTFAATKAAVYTMADKKVVYSVDDDPDGTYAFTPTSSALVSYSLNADGAIDSISSADVKALSATKKAMVLDGATTDWAISADVVVLSVTGSAGTLAVDLASIDEVTTGAMTGLEIIVNSDNKVVAMMVDAAYISSDTEATVGVFHKITDVKDGDDDVQKLYGFVDGVEFTALTDGSSTITVGNVVGTFGAFEVVTNANGVVTEDLVPITTLTTNAKIILGDGTATVSAISTDKTLVTITGGSKANVAEDAVYYEYNATTKTYSVGTKTSLSKSDVVILIDVVDDGDFDMKADIVIFK